MATAPFLMGAHVGPSWASTLTIAIDYPEMSSPCLCPSEMKDSTHGYSMHVLALSADFGQ